MTTLTITITPEPSTALLVARAHRARGDAHASPLTIGGSTCPGVGDFAGAGCSTSIPAGVFPVGALLRPTGLLRNA